MDLSSLGLGSPSGLALSAPLACHLGVKARVAKLLVGLAGEEAGPAGHQSWALRAAA